MRTIWFLVVFVLMGSTPFFVFAADNAPGLITCSGTDCNFCHFITLVKDVVNYVTILLILATTIMLAVTGVQMAMSTGNYDVRSVLKDRFTNIVIGFLLIIASWTIIDLMLKVLVTDGDTLSTWSGVMETWNGSVNELCFGLRSPVQHAITAENPATAPSTPGAAAPSAGCPECVQLTGVTCTHSCTADSAYAESMANVVSASGETITVTEAYPPTWQHQNQCHYNGTCTDIVFSDGNFNTDRILAFQSAAQNEGCRAVYEPPQGVSCPAGTDCQDWNITQSTGSHFSLYCQ